MNAETVASHGQGVDFSSSHQSSSNQDVVIDVCSSQDEHSVTELIRATLAEYQEAGSVLSSSYRRLERFRDVYQSQGATYFVAKNASDPRQIYGGAGIGPLHGLPPGEGVGELRDLVVAKSDRGKGNGSRLIKRCLEQAKKLGYQRLYLETTPQMEHAQQLFLRYGFRPVTEGNGVGQSQKDSVPCYFLLEKL